MPEALLTKMPIFNAALPSRLALVVAPVFGILLAWLATGLANVADKANPAVATTGDATDSVGTTAGPARDRLPGPRAAWVAGFVAALLPLVPIPLLGRDREPVPHFISSGAWQEYVSDGGTIVPVPLPNDLLPDGQRWQAAALAKAAGHGSPVFRLPSGFFLGPGGPDGTGRIGPIPRPTAALLEQVAKTGLIPSLSRVDRFNAREDLRYWDAQVVILADTVHGAHWDTHQPALLNVMTDLLGPPQRVDDVWLWHID
jgi:hypothetical protein